MCPFANKSDSRCATHWTIRNLFQAFSQCADRYSACPIYRALKQESFSHDNRQKAAHAMPVLAAS